jgi:hypothetical protein
LKKALDDVEALPEGAGTLDLGLHVNTNSAGAMVDYNHHVTEALSLFAEATAGWDFTSSAPFVEATTGLRLRF